jgi:cytoskeletal protein CcmA (bactofilin family)
MSLFGKSADAKRPEPPMSRPQAARPAVPVTTPPQLRDVGAAPAHAAACVIGAKTTVKGDVLGEEDIQIEGTVEGLIRVSRSVHVGTTGVVRATIEAATVVISGEVVGDCSAANRVEIQATGRLTGNIRAPRIVIAEGAVFRGNSDMSLPAPTS